MTPSPSGRIPGGVFFGDIKDMETVCKGFKAAGGVHEAN